MIEKYVYLIAALAADKNKSPQLDLMMGFHPEEKRLLTEEEENIDHIISLIRYVRMADILSESKSDPLCKNALLWLKYFPQLKQFSIYVGDELYSKLWETVLYNQTVLRLAYVFYPPNPVKNRKEWNDIREYAHVLQHEVDASLATDSRMTGKTCWTLPIPAQSALGRIIEAKAGVFGK